ncbi:TetR/AcrR family transcriptional regulator [Geminicoccus harenae]|uniref:TetR/AcrR family transcriptional regulator n=1 Tax=Geminicoccus harenae TaxID=2498453 RepID=UPI00168B4F11|nr:TetR family transcriptional regulator [Geminicoccus harenae]
MAGQHLPVSLLLAAGGSPDAQAGGEAVRKGRRRAPAKDGGDQAGPSMRDSILAVATELFTLNGFRGTSFADIAQILNITTTNIHYHFKNKQGLAAEALDRYAARVSEHFLRIWRDEQSSLAAKIEATIEFNRASYYRFNQEGQPGRVWSLLTRFAGDSEVVSDGIRQRIAQFRAEVLAAVEFALGLAVRQGELRAGLPQAELARMLSYAFAYAGEIARDSGGFAAVEANYRVLLDTLLRAHGSKPRAAVRRRAG